MGIHNEPGFNRLSTIPTSKELASSLLKLLLDQSDKDRAFVPFAPKDDTVLLVNNLGGISNLELSAFTGITVDQLGKEYGLSPKRVYAGAFMTALNGPGVSLTLLNLSRLSNPSTVLEALDAKTTASAWSGNVTGWQRVGVLDIRSSLPEESRHSVPQVSADPETFCKILAGAANALVKAEPEITKYDTIGTAQLNLIYDSWGWRLRGNSCCWIQCYLIRIEIKCPPPLRCSLWNPCNSRISRR